MKVKELRKHMYDAYLEELMATVDLDAFIKESLRLKEKFKEDTQAQGDFIERVCVKDYFLPNLHSNIPKGMRIQVA